MRNVSMCAQRGEECKDVCPAQRGEECKDVCLAQRGEECEDSPQLVDAHDIVLRLLW